MGNKHLKLTDWGFKRGYASAKAAKSGGARYGFRGCMGFNESFPHQSSKTALKGHKIFEVLREGVTDLILGYVFED